MSIELRIGDVWSAHNSKLIFLVIRNTKKKGGYALVGFDSVSVWACNASRLDTEEGVKSFLQEKNAKCIGNLVGVFDEL